MMRYSIILFLGLYLLLATPTNGRVCYNCLLITDSTSKGDQQCPETHCPGQCVIGYAKDGDTTYEILTCLTSGSTCDNFQFDEGYLQNIGNSRGNLKKVCCDQDRCNAPGSSAISIGYSTVFLLALTIMAAMMGF